jgi:hypothetical protein
MAKMKLFKPTRRCSRVRRADVLKTESMRDVAQNAIIRSLLLLKVFYQFITRSGVSGHCRTDRDSTIFGIISNGTLDVRELFRSAFAKIPAPT